MRTTSHADVAGDRLERAKLIYFEVVAAQVAEAVAEQHKWPGTPQLIVEAVVSRLYEKLDRALFGSADEPPWADASDVHHPVAWARSLFLRHLNETIWRVRERAAHASQEDIASISEVLLPKVPDIADACNEHDVVADVEVSNLLRRAHGLYRIQLQAQHVRFMYRVPAPDAPFTPEQKRALLQLLDANPHLVRQSIDRVLAGAIEELPLDRMWESFTRTQLNRLVEASEACLMVLVSAALAPRPRPNRTVLAAHRRSLKQMLGCRGWPSLMDRLQAAWLREFFSAQADYDQKSQVDPAPGSPSWEAICAEVVKFPGNPLGGCATEIDQTLLVTLNKDSPGGP